LYVLIVGDGQLIYMPNVPIIGPTNLAVSWKAPFGDNNNSFQYDTTRGKSGLN